MVGRRWYDRWACGTEEGVDSLENENVKMSYVLVLQKDES